MKVLKYILVILLIGSTPILVSAQVKIGKNANLLVSGDSSAVLILEDTTRGFLLPRMTIKQRDNIKPFGPATGLVVFVKDTKDTGLYVNYGTNIKPFWVKLSNASKDTILISHIDTIYNKVIQTDSIFSNTGRIDTIYNKISRVDTLFAKTAHFDTVTIGKLKIRISGNLNDSIVVVNPINDSVKRISPARLLSSVSNGKIDTIINNLIRTDSIFSNTGRIDTIYNKISRVDTLFAKTAHFDTVTIGKLKIRISGNLNDSIVVVNPINDSVKRISPARLLSSVSSGKIDTIINNLIRTDSIFSNTGRIDTIYNKISRVDTLFAKTAHFDTVTIGKLKIRISGNLNDSIVVVNPINDSVKRISPARLLSSVSSGKIDTIINNLMRTDSIFSNSARIDTIYNKISRVDTLFAKTAHFDTVTIGKLKIRISGTVNDSIVVVNPTNDSLKRISPTRLIANTAFVQQGNTFGTTAILGTRDANDLKLITNGDTLMTFKYANKSIGIGKVSPAYNLEIGGNMRCDTIYTKYVKMSADNSFSTFAVSVTGGIMVVSDSKYKENIQPYTQNALNALAQIPIVSYDWKSKDISPRHVTIGVIAQDVQKVLPDVVETDKAGNLSLKFNSFTYYLMKAVQELNTKTIAQEKELSTIKQQVKNVEDKNQTLQQQVDKLQSMVEALMKK